MIFMKQFARILLISFLGEMLKQLLPLPVPASIYGLVLMLVMLSTGLIPVRNVQMAGGFLIEIMPLMFIPAAVGIIQAWKSLKSIVGPVIFTIILTTILVMGIAGRVTQFVIRKEGKIKNEGCAE